MNVQNIIGKFTGDNLTDEKKAEIHAIESAWESHNREQADWENHAYDSGMSGSDFRQGRDAIAQKHRKGGVINPL